MAKKYSFLKRFVQAVPGLREALATAFTLLPMPLSAKAYAFLRRKVFRDNQPRMVTFERAFDRIKQSTGTGSVNYFEFGVARGTSVISSYMMARDKGLELKIFAFDSFEGLPSAEGDFVVGEMAYSDRTFRRFIEKAGVPSGSVSSIPGFFNISLTPELKGRLAIEPSIALFHNDSDLYESTRDVLNWIESLALPGSVVIFDDWHSFRAQSDPSQFGEQRAFGEWRDRENWELLYLNPDSNVAFVKKGETLCQ